MCWGNVNWGGGCRWDPNSISISIPIPPLPSFHSHRHPRHTPPPFPPFPHEEGEETEREGERERGTEGQRRIRLAGGGGEFLFVVPVSFLSLYLRVTSHLAAPLSPLPLSVLSDSLSLSHSDSGGREKKKTLPFHSPILSFCGRFLGSSWRSPSDLLPPPIPFSTV